MLILKKLQIAKVLILLLTIIGSTLGIYRFYNNKNIEEPIQYQNFIGGVIPHHDIAFRMKDNFFSKYQSDKIKKIVLVGPNHDEIGVENILEYDKDNSITDIIPYLRKYYPNATVKTYVLKNKTPFSEIDEFTNKIINDADNNTLVFASIDFSHYLNTEKAQINSQKVEELVNSKNFGEILKLNSTYLDSPASLVTMLLLAEKLSGKVFFEEYGNSALITQNPTANTVSYFTISLKTQNPLPEKEVESETKPITTLLITGDIIPARSVNFLSVNNKDYIWTLKNISEPIKNADISFINLETPLIADCPLTNEGFKFCGNSKHTQGLEYAGVDVAGLANNHISNYGKEGIDETVKNLSLSNIKSVGAGNENIVYHKVNGIKFAFLSFNDIGYEETHVNWAKDENLKKYIPLAKAEADIVVVALHWGVEYTDTPSQRQINLGRTAVDLGADIVAGNHPHNIQPYEIYNGSYVLYALGNTVFDQEWSKETKRGALAEFIFEGKKVKELRFIPIKISEYGKADLDSDYSFVPKKL